VIVKFVRDGQPRRYADLTIEHRDPSEPAVIPWSVQRLSDGKFWNGREWQGEMSWLPAAAEVKS